MKKVALCHPDRPHLARGFCQSCYKQWEYKQYPERRARNRAYHSLPKQRERASTLKRKRYAESLEFRNVIAGRGLRSRYGISFDDFGRKIVEQGNRCAACGRKFVGEMRDRTGLAPTVHHDHSIKEPHCLAIVHRKCNAAMGQMNDDPGLLYKLAEFAGKCKQKAVT